MVAVFCSIIGSKVREVPSITILLVFSDSNIRERRLAPRNAVGHVFALARVPFMIELRNFFVEVLASNTQVFNTEAEFITHFLNFPARAIVQYISTQYT